MTKKKPTVRTDERGATSVEHLRAQLADRQQLFLAEHASQRAAIQRLLLERELGREWLSIAGYARLYGLSRTTVYKLLEAQLLTVFRTKGRGRATVTRVRNVPPKASAS